MKTAYPILQSGFLAKSETGLAKTPQPEEEKIIKAIELGKPFDSNGNPFFYDLDLDTLYTEFSTDPRLVKSFEFRERFLTEIKNSFAYTRFADWILLQEESPYFTHMHRRLVDDTVKFILTGERDISIESWSGLIYPRLKSQMDIGKVFSDDVRYLIKDVNPTLSRAIAMWTSHQNGWNDLFTFVGIVFTMQTGRSV